MDPNQPQPVVIQYTVNELLSRIDGKIDTLTMMIHGKAERQELDSLENRVRTVEKESATITAVDKNSRDIEINAAKHKWMVLATVGSWVTAATALILQYLHH